mmetsp:Transcript_103531/g.259578  ORF Transcript_103531/g.259578 Transcript_103531/m.259578 type:complete len:203 (-) Transcript_103531:37-645(-)
MAALARSRHPAAPATAQACPTPPRLSLAERRMRRHTSGTSSTEWVSTTRASWPSAARTPWAAPSRNEAVPRSTATATRRPRSTRVRAAQCDTTRRRAWACQAGRRGHRIGSHSTTRTTSTCSAGTTMTSYGFPPMRHSIRTRSSSLTSRSSLPRRMHSSRPTAVPIRSSPSSVRSSSPLRASPCQLPSRRCEARALAAICDL